MDRPFCEYFKKPLLKDMLQFERTTAFIVTGGHERIEVTKFSDQYQILTSYKDIKRQRALNFHENRPMILKHVTAKCCQDAVSSKVLGTCKARSTINLDALMNVNLLKLCANVVEILSFEAPPSRAVLITLGLVQVTTVSVINDSYLAETGSLCWGVFKTLNGKTTKWHSS